MDNNAEIASTAIDESQHVYYNVVWDYTLLCELTINGYKHFVAPGISFVAAPGAPILEQLIYVCEL